MITGSHNVMMTTNTPKKDKFNPTFIFLHSTNLFQSFDLGGPEELLEE